MQGLRAGALCRALSRCALQIPLIFAGLTFVVGAAIMAGAVHIAMVIVGRLILGLGVGVGTTVRPQRLSPLNMYSAFRSVTVPWQLWAPCRWCRPAHVVSCVFIITCLSAPLAAHGTLRKLGRLTHCLSLIFVGL